LTALGGIRRGESLRQALKNIKQAIIIGRAVK